MKAKHLATSDQKISYWGYGEWVEEPDEVEWQYKNILCKIQRNMKFEGNFLSGFGHLCGYIFIPKDHPWNLFEEYCNIPCKIHGGLTFYSQKEDLVEIGFDCAHLKDETPYSVQKSYEYLLKNTSPNSEIYDTIKSCLEGILELNKKFEILNLPTKTYKNIAFVKKECESLVDQALELRDFGIEI